MMPRRNAKASSPEGLESIAMVDLGEPVYAMKLPPGGSVVALTAADDAKIQDLGEPTYKSVNLPTERRRAGRYRRK